MNDSFILLSVAPIVVAQTAVVLIISTLLGFVIKLAYEHFKPTEEEQEKKRQRRAMEDAAWKEELAARDAEFTRINAEREALLKERADLPKPPATVRGGLVKAGLILMLLSVVVLVSSYVFFQKVLVEFVFIFSCGVVVLVIGACLPPPVSAPHD